MLRLMLHLILRELSLIRAVYLQLKDPKSRHVKKITQIKKFKLNKIKK